MLYLPNRLRLALATPLCARRKRAALRARNGKPAPQRGLTLAERTGVVCCGASVWPVAHSERAGQALQLGDSSKQYSCVSSLKISVKVAPFDFGTRCSSVAWVVSRSCTFSSSKPRRRTVCSMAVSTGIECPLRHCCTTHETTKGVAASKRDSFLAASLTPFFWRLSSSKEKVLSKTS